jgi:gluconolactonase
VNQLDKFTFLVAGLDHPEGLAWGADGHLYAGGEAGQLYRVDVEAGSAMEIASTGGYLLGLALDGQGHVYGCDQVRQEVVRIRLSDGSIASYARGTAESPMRVPNWLVFDRGGHLYVSDSGEWNADDGLIYKIGPAGAAAVWSRGACRYTNGMALNRAETHLYVVESLLPGVSRLAIAQDGSAGDYEVVVELPRTVPDGLAFAEDGTLFISCYAPDRIYALSPAGHLEMIAEDPQRFTLASPTNLAFAGSDRDLLVVANLAAYHLAAARLGVRGAPLNYPRLGNGGR